MVSKGGALGAHEEKGQPVHTLKRRLSLSRLDATAGTVIGLLLMAILATALVGDFRRPGERIAYLGPATASVQNIWLADPHDLENPQQVTFSGDGIYNFDVSADGRYLAFAERSSDYGTTEIKMLDLYSGALRQLTNCANEDADCKTPVWSPDGRMIAYERTELNSSVPNAGVSPIRVWLINLNANPITTRPLFEDSQILGYSPQWSGNGQRIAVFDQASSGILIYDFTDGSTSLVPSRYGDVGSLSPNGEKLVFPEMVRKGNQMFAHLRIADLANQAFSELTPQDEPIDDTSAVWHPDGQRLAIARKYTDDRFTQGHQVYLLDSISGDAVPLVEDRIYNSSFFEWNPEGEKLLMQRFPMLTESGDFNNNGLPEIWIYDLETENLLKVAEDAFHPRWVAAG